SHRLLLYLSWRFNATGFKTDASGRVKWLRPRLHPRLHLTRPKNPRIRHYQEAEDCPEQDFYTGCHLAPPSCALPPLYGPAHWRVVPMLPIGVMVSRDLLVQAGGAADFGSGADG